MDYVTNGHNGRSFVDINNDYAFNCVHVEMMRKPRDFLHLNQRSITHTECIKSNFRPLYYSKGHNDQTYT